MTFEVDRRTVLLASAGAVVGLSGCLGGNGWDIDEDAPPEEQIEQFLDGVNGETELQDYTDGSDVVIENGTSDDVSGFAFNPAAIRIAPGTTVVWEWVDGSAHTVTHENGDAFDSGLQSGAGYTFEQTFDDDGLYLYLCEPHEQVQRGAVLVG